MSHKSWLTRLQFKYAILTLASCIVLLYFFQMRILINKNPRLGKYYNGNYQHSSKILNNLQLKYLIDTPGCKIQDFLISDPAINSFIFKTKKIICNRGKKSLFASNQTSIFLIESALIDYNIVTSADMKCCYQYFRRRNPQQNEKDIHVIYSQECINLNTIAHVNSSEDFVKVQCNYTNSEETIYEDYFHFISIKNKEKVPESHLNVLLLGLDSVSRLNFHRQMPKTAEFLNSLSAIELFGYNKIGDNTFPNLIAVLTGMTEAELQDSCWQNATTSFFDECDFIWNRYNDSGYVTAFGEDAAWMGLFNFQRKGFRQQPTDYYYDHFDYIATNRTGNSQKSNVHECLGSRPAYEVFLQYIENFVFGVRRMEEKSERMPKKYFGFFWSSSLTHDFLNHPQLGDARLTQFLQDFNQKGVFDDTVLILLSDHGMRWGSIRATYQGNIEERLPFIYIILPTWFKNKYPELVDNLNVNAQRLSTPYDLHQTLIDLLKSSKVSGDGNNNDDIKNDNIHNQGISLFREIPLERTCDDAGIGSHWCTCQRSVPLAVNNSDIELSVHFTLYQHINNMLFDYPECYQLRLDEIIEGRSFIDQNEDENCGNKVICDFGVTFRTIPGGAVFEATVRKTNRWGKVDYSVAGTVSRLNLYGNQSVCMSDYHLKLYCYCKLDESDDDVII